MTTRALQPGAKFGGGVELWWLNLLSPAVLLVLGVIVLVGLIIAVLVGWLVLRRVRRSRSLRRWVETGKLTARAHASPAGAAREAAELRMRLRGARERVGEALAAVNRRGASDTALAHLPALGARLDASAAGLDERLAMLERQPPERVENALPEFREQVQLLEEAEGTLHRGVELSALPQEGGGDLQRLQQDLDTEVQALQARQDAYRDLGGGPGPPDHR